MNYAVKLNLEKGTLVRVVFSNGVTKRYDVMKLSKKYPQLKKLKDRNLFLKGYLESWDGITWNEELDLSADTIYCEGDTVETTLDDLYAIIGFHLKFARLKSNLTQIELAEKVKVNQADISRIEKGEASPSIETISRIANGLGKKVTIQIR